MFQDSDTSIKVNGNTLTFSEILLTLTAVGAWHISAIVEPFTTTVALYDSVDFYYRDVHFLGTINNIVSYNRTSQQNLTIFPGSGLTVTVPDQFYREASLRMILTELFSQAGEVLSEKSIIPTKTIPKLFLTEGNITQALHQLGLLWHCLPNGEIIIGSTYPEREVSVSYYETQIHALAGKIDLEVPMGLLFPTGDNFHTITYSEKAKDFSIVGEI